MNCSLTEIVAFVLLQMKYNACNVLMFLTDFIFIYGLIKIFFYYNVKIASNLQYIKLLYSDKHRKYHCISLQLPVITKNQKKKKKL